MKKKEIVNGVKYDTPEEINLEWMWNIPYIIGVIALLVVSIVKM